MIQSPSKRACSGPLAPRPRSRPRSTTRRAGALSAALALLLGLALSATTGCMVMDELDTAAAKMPVSNNKKDAAPASSRKAPSPAKAMDDPDFIRVSRQMDQPPVYRGPEDLGRHLVKMNEEVGSLIQKLGLLEK